LLVVTAVCAFLCAPVCLQAQTVTLGGTLGVAAAEDFATRSFQDPWDMNERTDFGWFLHGADLPSPQVTNISFSGGVFHATTGTSPNLFLLETGNPFAARLGRTGTNYPIDADTYKLIAIRMSINGSPQSTFVWNRNDLWDGTQSSSNIVNLSAGWRTYLIDMSALGIRSGSTPWSGLLRSLQFSPSYLTQFNIDIDWIRLVNINPSLCRQVTWSGLTSGQFELHLSDSNGGTSAATLLAPAQEVSTGNSDGCANTGSGYNFYAGGLAPGSYRVIARRVSDGAIFPSSNAYVVNAAPTLTVTSPSEEGSSDDYATAQLGNPWDMNATTDVDQFFNVTGPQITTIQAETPAGVALPNTVVLAGTSVPPPQGQVGDPRLAMLWEGGANAGARIDPVRYRILTVEFGLPNKARHINEGSIARIVWRVAGAPAETVSDDIIFNSRVGANVLDKFSLDLADRAVLSIESTSPSQLGWVPGGAASPGIDRFRFDVHEFNTAVPFHVRRVKLAALERVASGTNYTIRWIASEGGTVTIFRDTDRNQFNGGLTQIGSVTAASGVGSFLWPANAPVGEYYIYVVVNDNQGNSNASYSRWPIVIGAGGGPLPPSPPPNPRIIQ
jgi:hypothetical protein